MKLGTSFDYVSGELAAAFKGVEGPVAEASTEALRAAVDYAKLSGRASIAAAGFSRRWQNALRGEAYPKRGASLNAAGAVFHKIPYADVFESGAQIRGKPRLWVPMSSTPKQYRRKPMTPERFAREIGGLFPMGSSGRAQILGAKMKVSKAAAKRGPPYKISMSALSRASQAGGTGVTVSVPLFVGIPVVSIKKKFGVTAAVKAAADDLPNLYERFLKGE